MAMNMKNKYQNTIYACFTGYTVQAIVNNFVPLLFLTFAKIYNIPLSQITMLITFNFGVQLLVDYLSAKFVDRIGYRVSIVLAHVFSALGLILLTILPDLLSNSFAGLLMAVVIYAVGGGLLEVLVSPIVESCPSDNKEKAMSLLHSFYCWGHVAVVLLSTLFFHFFGIENWKFMAVAWALVPIVNGIAFTRVPIASLIEEGESGMTIRELLKNRLFWILLLMMICAGASEQGVSQWASTFAEKGLNVSKAIGDLAGPMTFAILMGVSRAFYGKFGDRIDLDRFMVGSSGLCILSYLCISFAPTSFLSLVGCAVCGLSVGIMWPGTFSKAASSLRKGGTAMFALLALGGDVGCSAGPTLVGLVTPVVNDNLKIGILAAVVFPVLLILGIFLLRICMTKGAPRGRRNVPKCILFDLDGTLLPMDNDEFTKGYFKLLAKKLVPFGYEPQKLVDAIWQGTGAMVRNDGSRTNEKAFWEEFVKIYGQKALDDEPLFDAFYRNEFQQARTICGENASAVALINEIKEMGYRVALATNPIFPAVATESRIRWIGLEPSDFEIVTTYENSGFCKPNPAYYEFVARMLGVKPEECLMVGNDVTEDMVAEKVGMKVFLLTDCLINRENKDISCYPNGSFADLKRFIKDL